MPRCALARADLGKPSQPRVETERLSCISNRSTRLPYRRTFLFLLSYYSIPLNSFIAQAAAPCYTPWPTHVTSFPPEAAQTRPPPPFLAWHEATPMVWWDVAFCFKMATGWLQIISRWTNVVRGAIAHFAWLLLLAAVLLAKRVWGTEMLLLWRSYRITQRPCPLAAIV